MTSGSGFKRNSAAICPSQEEPWTVGRLQCIDELPMEITYDWHTMEPINAAPASVRPVSATS